MSAGEDSRDRRRDQSDSPSDGAARNAEDAGGPERSGRGRAAVSWVAGILSAVVIAAIGVVFTTWYGSRGVDAIDRISGSRPVNVVYVDIDESERKIALRERVSDSRERVIFLGRDGVQYQALRTRHHAALIGEMQVTVVLEGSRSTLRIVDIQPRVLTKGPVSKGALLVPTTAGEVGTIELSADLDRPTPRFTTPKNRRTPYFTSKQIDLKRDERVTLVMSIKGRKAYYEFDLVATVIAEGRTEKISIKGPDGTPFRLTGPAVDYDSVYVQSSIGGWTPVTRERQCTIVPKSKAC